MKMKKYLLILFVGLLSVVSCENFLNVNDDPNYPSEVPVSLIFPAAQNAVAEVVGDPMYNFGAIFCQYLDQAPEANQYNTLCEYDITQSTVVFDGSYSTLYARALEDIDRVLVLSENTADRFAATVLRAYILQLVVDVLDNAPYTEALQGSSIPMPVWDNGEDVYAGVLAEIDAAFTALDPNEAMECSDLVFDKDIDQWVGFANALKLRMLMRASNVQDNAAAIQAIVDEGVFFEGDVYYAPFSNQSGKRNPFYEANTIELGTKNHVASLPFVKYLQSTADPRISWYYEMPTVTGASDYIGAVPGTSRQSYNDNMNEDYSFYKTTGKSLLPVYFMTQGELQFLLAEAYVRFENDNAKALDAYEAAVEASFATLGVTGSATFLTGNAKWNSAATETEKLNLIYLQKWVGLAMLNNAEAWAEVRRTGVPSLSNQTAAAVSGDPTLLAAGNLVTPAANPYGISYIQRLPYPETAVKLNDNTPDQPTLDAKIWWAQ